MGQEIMSKLKYTGLGLDRANELRKDKDWLNNRLNNLESIIIPLWQNNNLIAFKKSDPGYPKAIVCKNNFDSNILSITDQVVFLGLQNNTPVFAADFSSYEKEKVNGFFKEGEFTDIRKAGPLLNYYDAALLAYARGMIYWNQNYKYCSACGHPNLPELGGHLRICTNKKCKKQSFPRTDPAVIMLVEYKPENNKEPLCLLGRQKVWPKGVYSTLAGFVDIGESLEEAVAREVFEEAGVEIENITYEASQPWPFPSSLMVGFYAQAKSTKLNIDKDEMDDANWFSLKELEKAGDWHDESSDFRVPRVDSIASYLLNNWMIKVKSKEKHLS